MIRLFIAIKVSRTVADYLEDVSQGLQRELKRGVVRWVPPEQRHLTLVFLGDTAEDKVPALSATLDTITRTTAPFSLRLAELGCFPNPRRPRVIWGGLQDSDGQLARLKQALDGALAPLGWRPEDRPFQPHLTLGRVKLQDGALAALPWGQMLTPHLVPVTVVHLIQSVLRPQGPEYTVRHSSRLSGERMEDRR